MPDPASPRQSGKSATNPSRFGWRDWGAVLVRVWNDIGLDHLSVLAAGVAFFAMLSLFPAIAALIAIYGLVADPADVATHLDRIEPLLPRDAYALIDNQVRAVIAVGNRGLGLASALGLLVSLWSMRAAVGALIEGLNVVYAEHEKRGIVHLVLISLGLSLLLLLLGIVAIAAIVAVPTVLQIVPLGRWGPG